MNNSETNMKKENKLKKLIKGFFSKCKKHKFITVFIFIVIVVMIVAAYNVKNNVEQLQQEEYSFIRTTTLTKDGLETAVNVTGSVESSNTSTVSYSAGMNASAPKIKTVNVTVGDYVEEGDIIVVLDNTDILEKITEQQEIINEKSAELYEKYENSIEVHKEAVDAYNNSKTATTNAYNTMVNAENALNSAKSKIADYQTNYDKAVKYENEVGIEYAEKYFTLLENENAAKVEYEKLKEAYENLNPNSDANSYDNSCSDSYNAESYADNIESEVTAVSKEDVDTAKDKYDNAKTAAENLAEKYDDAKRATEDAKSLLDTAKQASGYNECEKNYNSAVSAYNSAASTQQQLDVKEETARADVEQAYENYVNSQTSDTLEDLQEQLENCNLKAETSGKVTALSAVVGNTVNGTVATIQDTENLKISVTISEADINTVEIGMKCKIRSDATEGYISGTLIQIDPVSSMGGSFGAEIVVNGGAQGLLIGMNADVDIIISEIADCFTVPADAIGEDEQGKFIYRHTSGEGVDMEFEKIYITVGESNDYYVEISSDELAEGDIIRSYSDLTIGIETVSGEDAAQMQGFGNMFGDMDGMSFGDAFGGNGEMPSMPDGGNFPSGGGNGERPQMPSGGGFSGGNGGGMP